MGGVEECSELRDQPAATRWREELPPELFQVDGREEEGWAANAKSMASTSLSNIGSTNEEYFPPLLCVCAFAPPEVRVIHASSFQPSLLVRWKNLKSGIDIILPLSSRCPP